MRGAASPERTVRLASAPDFLPARSLRDLQLERLRQERVQVLNRSEVFARLGR